MDKPDVSDLTGIDDLRIQAEEALAKARVLVRELDLHYEWGTSLSEFPREELEKLYDALLSLPDLSFLEQMTSESKQESSEDLDVLLHGRTRLSKHHWPTSFRLDYNRLLFEAMKHGMHEPAEMTPRIGVSSQKWFRQIMERVLRSQRQVGNTPALLVEEANQVEISISVDDDELRPELLSNVVVPYIKAIEALQQVIDELNGKAPRQLIVNGIWQGSINFSIQGGAEAVQWIRDKFEKWRPAHAKKVAKLQEKELEVNLAAANLELEVQRGLIDSERRKAEAEAAKTAAEAEQIRLENQEAIRNRDIEQAIRYEALRQEQLKTQQMRLDLEREKFQLALEFVREVKPNLSGDEALYYVERVKSSVDTLLETGASQAPKK